MDDPQVTSIYTSRRREQTNVNVPLIKLFYKQYLQYEYGPPTDQQRQSPDRHQVIQQICAENTHLDLWPTMSDDEFMEKYCQAIEQTFAATLAEARKINRCRQCGKNYTLLTSAGRHECRYHPGMCFDGRRYTCCQSVRPCVACDHYADEVTPQMFSILHCTLLPIFRIPKESLYYDDLAPQLLDSKRLMSMDEAKCVAMENCAVFVRTRDDGL